MLSQLLAFFCQSHNVNTNLLHYQNSLSIIWLLCSQDDYLTLYGKKKKKRSTELGNLLRACAAFLRYIVPVSQAPSLEQNHNALFPVNASVVPYSTH